MKGRRAKKHLESSLFDAQEARRYISEFKWVLSGKLQPGSFVLKNGREIFFKDMSDSDAIRVALEVLRFIQIPRDERDLQYEKWEH